MSLFSTSNFSDYQIKVIMHMSKWRSQANCGLSDTQFFYDVEESIMKNHAAKKCVVCPVQNHCLYTAIVLNEKYGVWGALTPRQRRILYRNLKSEARFKEIDTENWNKDFDDFLFANTKLQNAYNLLIN